jgi:hypothetical protein
MKRQKGNNVNAAGVMQTPLRDEMRINIGDEVAGSADWERSSMASGFSVISKSTNANFAQAQQ